MSAAIDTYLRDVPSHVIVLEPGQYLFHLGDPVRCMHIVHAGRVHLVRYQRDGSALVLQRAGVGSIVAEASLYSETYHCDGVADEPVRLLAFAKSGVHQRLRADPDFAGAWAMYLAHELQRARLQAEILSIRTVAKRLDAWLAARGGEGPYRGDWKTVANEIGVSPEALYREMAKRRGA